MKFRLFLYFVRHSTQMSSPLKNKLDRIFFGDPPKMFSIFNEESIKQALAKQGAAINESDKIPDLININYVTLIQDVFELTKESAEDYFRAVDELGLERAQSNNRILMVSMHLETMQDKNRDPSEKLSLSFFYRRLLQVFKSIYQLELVSKQDEFISELYQWENFYANQMQQEMNNYHNQLQLAIMKEHEADESSKITHHDNFELSPLWKRGIDKLKELSQDLYAVKFTESIVSFQNVFNNNSPLKCNWLKERTTLLYLLWSLFDEGGEKPSTTTIDICCSKFVVKGKDTTRKVAQSTDIQKQINTPSQKLKGNFEIIDSIIKPILFSKHQ